MISWGCGLNVISQRGPRPEVRQMFSAVHIPDMYPITSIPIRLALAGLGHIAEFQLPALAEVKEFTLVAACDPNRDRWKLAPVGVACFPSTQEMLSQTTLDAVLISTPTATHFAVAQEFLTAGKHVLVEKPATTSLTEFDELTTLAERHEILLHSALHMAHGSETDWASAWAGEHRSELGPIVRFNSHFRDPLCVNGVLHARGPSVLGSWMDSGINALSVLARFVEMETLMLADADFRRDPMLPVQDVSSLIQFQGPDIHGSITTDWTEQTNLKTTVLEFVSGITMELNHTLETVTWNHDTATTRKCSRGPVRLVDHYIQVFRGFAEALSQQRDLTGNNTNQSLSRELLRLHLAPLST